MCAQQNSLANLDQLPAGNLLTRLSCNLGVTDDKTLRLYERVASAAVKYRKEDFKAKRYAHRVERFASNIIMAFEGLKNGEYSQEEVFQDFTTNMEANKQNLLTPLREVTDALANAADDVFSLIQESGHLVGEYQLAGRWFEAMNDATAIVSENQGVMSALSSLPNLLSLSSSGFSTAVAVFSVMSRAVASWGEVERRKMKENEELLKAFNNQLSEVARIMQEQQLVLQMAFDIVGLDMTTMGSTAAERHTTSGQPTTLMVNNIIKAAKELEALCQSFLGNR